MARAEKAELLAAEERHDERPWGPAGSGERAGEADDHGGARGVVVGAGVEDAVLGPEVVVVGAEQDGLVGDRRIRARKDADDIRRAALVGRQVHAEAQVPEMSPARADVA